MILHIEKVMPAGTNRFGRASDNCCVVLLFKGSPIARKFTITVAMKPAKLPI